MGQVVCGTRSRRTHTRGAAVCADEPAMLLVWGGVRPVGLMFACVGVDEVTRGGGGEGEALWVYLWSPGGGGGLQVAGAFGCEVAFHV